MSLKALALNGTLKSSDSSEASSTGKLLKLIAEEFNKHDVETETVVLPITTSSRASPLTKARATRGRTYADRFWTPTSCLSARRSGSDSQKAFANVRWSGWTHFWKRPTTRAA
jgi:hypothetical protein